MSKYTRDLLMGSQVCQKLFDLQVKFNIHVFDLHMKFDHHMIFDLLMKFDVNVKFGFLVKFDLYIKLDLRVPAGGETDLLPC